MTLAAPAALWLALSLPAIVALWLLRPRRTRTRVPSLLLWSGAEVERHSARPWQRLRHHPLLWLQLLLAALLVAAAVRPFVPAAAGSQSLVLVLDASGSMRATDLAPSRFAAARERALDVARSLGPGQRLTLIRLDGAPRVILAEAGPDDVERSLARQEPGYGAGDLQAALALAEGVGAGPGEWILVTDGALDVPADTRVPPGISLHTVLVTPADPGGNVAISGLRVRLEDDRASVQAGVRNLGDAPATGRLVLAGERGIIGGKDWSLEPGEERHLTWIDLPPSGGWYEARLADVPDAVNALTHDDRAWAGAVAPSARRVLLVSDGNTFVERALAALGDVRADRVNPGGWEAVARGEDPYQVVIFDGAWPSEPPPGNLLAVGRPSADAFVPGRLHPDPLHPLMRQVDWSDVTVASARVLPIDASWQIVLDSDGGPLLAVREREGRREAMLAFSLSDTDLALRPAFPVLVANLLEWLAPRAGGGVLFAAPGAPVRIEAAPLSERIWVEDDSGEAIELAPPWPPAPFRAPSPGRYRLVQDGPGGRQEQLIAVSGYDPADAALDARPLSLQGVDEDRAAGPLPSARAIWPWIALAVLAVSLVEWWLDARGR